MPNSHLLIYIYSIYLKFYNFFQDGNVKHGSPSPYKIFAHVHTLKNLIHLLTYKILIEIIIFIINLSFQLINHTFFNIVSVMHGQKRIKSIDTAIRHCFLEYVLISI